MEYLVTSEEMKRYDKNTSMNLKIPECVLMERASLGIADTICTKINEHNQNLRPVFVCGFGNNGADGVCCARLLIERGIESDVILIGNASKATELNILQRNILSLLGGHINILSIRETTEFLSSKNDSFIVIDALFGVGLSRPLDDEYALLADAIQKYASYVISVDVPSGLFADCGVVNGPVVKADETVTFGFKKACHALFPGAEFCGKVNLIQMGITEKSITGEKPRYKAITSLDDYVLPKAKAGANKGTYKKLLIIAGSREVYGAAFLAAKSALACGIGMISILTHEKNRLVLEQTIPEAMYRFYDDGIDEAELKEMYAQAEKWADGILIGPGLGLDKCGETLTKLAITESTKPLVADADALRIIAKKEELQKHLSSDKADRKVIATPHLAEFADLAGISVKEAKDGIDRYPKLLADKMHITVNCKDAGSVIASWDERDITINCTGNDGMASGGSGDVLSGITAVLLLQMSNAYEAASMAAYMHGLAGDKARDKWGRRAMTATNIIEELFYLWEA